MSAGTSTSSAVTDVRVRWRSSASDPDCTVRPARMIETSSHSASTSARMWLDSNTVRPSRRTSRMHRWNSDSISGSRPDVGSSSTSSSARDASAAIRATFWRLPLEYVRARLVGSSSNRATSSSRRAGSKSPRIRPSRSMVSPPVSLGHSETSPGTYASRRCNATASAHGSPPSSSTRPPSARSRPSRIRIVVDLPAPLGPRNPWIVPGSTSRSRPSSAVVDRSA